MFFLTLAVTKETPLEMLFLRSSLFGGDRRILTCDVYPQRSLNLQVAKVVPVRFPN